MIKTGFTDSVQELIEQVEEKMLVQADGNHPQLAAAVHHLLASGGKRIRVALTLLTGGLFKANPEHLVTLAAAIELLHTATLVHDDFIDGSLIRRGIPTLNAQWSPAATVLTGDFIFARAAKLAAETDSIPVMLVFAQTLAVIVDGEINQLFSRRGLIGREEYNQRIYAKTASLFEAATTTAALLSQVSEEALQSIKQFGFHTGMAFQIIDDVLDFTGEQATVGKPVASDLRQGLVTLPVLYYLEVHPDDPDVLALLDGYNDDRGMIIDRLLPSIRRSGVIERAVEEAGRYINLGLESLAFFPASPERQGLEDLANYIWQRRK